MTWGKRHCYKISTIWTGNAGRGTEDYRAYRRDHEIAGDTKTAPIPGSAGAVFRGDPHRYNPEELLVASLSACHMLWYLHLCADSGIVVTAYSDEANGEMQEFAGGSGAFRRVMLHPKVTITDESRRDEALALHAKAHEFCYIANSVRFPVQHQPEIVVAG